MVPDLSPELRAAREVAARLRTRLEETQGGDPATRSAVLRDLGTVEAALWADPERRPDAYAFGLATPWERIRTGPGTTDPSRAPAGTTPAATGTPSGPRVAATESIASRAGALSDEVDFPSFVAGLLHGTFDAVVDATIRQIEEFASLVGAVAKDVDTFTRDNVTLNQVRDTLAEQHPADLVLDLPASGVEPRLRVRAAGGEDDEPRSPAWLADYGLGGQELTDELVEEQLLPAARRGVGESRLQLLATMVLLGMNRVVVRDGKISARLRFRAAARDTATVAYAASQDPGGQTWSTRGSTTYDQHTTMVSTVGVNMQSDSDLEVGLFGQVEINFASETLPLDRFVDSARMTLLQRNARWERTGGQGTIATGPADAAPAALPAAPAATATPAPTPAVPSPSNPAAVTAPAAPIPRAG